MWTCKLLKQNARSALQGRYWRCFLVCLVLALLGAGGETFTIQTNGDTAQVVENYLSALPDSVLLSFVIAALLVLLVSIAMQIFLIQPLEVGRNRYFMESRQAPAPYSTVTTIFQPPYGNVVKVRALVMLKIALGTLLIIPGIYWSYCYAMVPWLLAENPYLTAQRAMELSKDMMEGEKLHYFGLSLSFFGWALLAALVVIGGWFLTPYIVATDAEFYAAMRSKALATGMTTTEELGGFVRHESL